MAVRFELIQLRAQGADERFLVPEEGLYIGRGSEGDIVLADPMVSRRHAHVWRGVDGLRVQDLDSRNGIEINGQRVAEGKLDEGDTLVIGGTLFRISRASESTLGRTVIEAEQAAGVHERLVQDGGDERIAVLYRAAQLLGTVFDMEDLFRRLLALIFEALPARRGFVLTVTANGETEIRASHSLESGDGPPLSHTLIKHVFETNDAMLTLDAQEDSRFDPSESIMSHHIHAAMCAPLCGRDAVVGAIYVDSGGVSEPFKQEDLEMLTAIARVVGVAVENARLYQESVANARLAAVGMATAGLGHCVKNILTGIRGGAEFINRALNEDDLHYLRKGWPILSQAIDRIDLLVNNMLSFSREHGPERQAVDLNSMVEDVLALVKPRAERMNVQLEQVAEGSGRAYVDGHEIYRVILNLVMNGIDACIGDGGTVSVKVRPYTDGIAMEVEDTGCGIPASILPRLSEAFVSTKGSSGTGLGLACSYKIVREHDGRIDVESTPGEGTRFIVLLPSQAEPERPTRQIEI